MRLICPGLFGPKGSVSGPLPETPALDRLLARADCRETDLRDPLESLALAYGLGPAAPGRDLPFAALCVLAEAPELASQGCWLHADPVYLRPDRDRLVLFAGPSLDVQEFESKALLSAFNDHFADDGLELLVTGTGRWYLRVREVPKLRTCPVHAVHGQAVDAYLPTGADARNWARWQNEAQMLFFQHPVNRDREAAGRPTVGGVWTWGSGPLPQVPSSPGLTVTDAPLGIGLARASGGRVTGLNALIRTAEGWPSIAIDSAVAFWDRQWWPAIEGDWGAWGHALAEFETLAQRLLAGLETGRIRTLTIEDGIGRSFAASRRSLLRFWRRGAGLRAGMGPV